MVCKLPFPPDQCPNYLNFLLSGHTSWPFSLIVHGPGNQDVRCTPKNDFFVALCGIPQIICEFFSNTLESDRIRMLAHGASLVRIMNKLQVENLQQERSFVMMAIYFPRDSMTITQYLLYQNAESDAFNTVCNGTKVVYRECQLIKRASRYIIAPKTSATPVLIGHVSSPNYTIGCRRKERFLTGTPS